jgi:ribosomal protein S18 acetylase RimI-like enzyme
MLRRATEEDARAIAAVFRRAYGTLTFLPTLHTADEDRLYFAQVVAHQDVWVAEVEGSVVGFAALADRTLTNLYVEPDHQRTSLGAQLLEHVKKQRPEGFELWVFQRNDGARRFYGRHGCRLVRLTDGARNEEREPDALYEWRP